MSWILNTAFAATTEVQPTLGLANASTQAAGTDLLFFTLLISFSLIALVIMGFIIYFCVRYRKGQSADRANPPLSNAKLEGGLIAFILLVGVGIFFWGGSGFLDLSRVPNGAYEVHVYPKQWMWKFQHPNGRREVDELHVPVGQDVRLTMISQDVIHSLFIPAFRIKEDALPGRYTYTWFHATQSGRFEILCTQYCGTNHSSMRASIVVMEPKDFAHWLADDRGTVVTERAPEGRKQPLNGAALSGQQIYERLGCASCHAQDRGNLAPGLQNLYGQQVELANGTRLTADENYLRTSILTPNAQITKGYSAVMPTFEGLLSESEMTELITYIKGGLK